MRVYLNNNGRLDLMGNIDMEVRGDRIRMVEIKELELFRIPDAPGAADETFNIKEFKIRHVVAEVGMYERQAIIVEDSRDIVRYFRGKLSI